MKKLQAIIFDVDGTLANTEQDGHRVAFNQAFAEAGLEWNWDVALYGELLAVTGGKERIAFYLERTNISVNTGDKTLAVFIAHLHQRKTFYYLELLKTGQIPLRDGVLGLLKSAQKAGLILTIATTTTPENVTVLLENQLGKESLAWFKVIGAGDIVPHKKPAPDIYQYVLTELGLSADVCIAIEDSKNGLLSAKQAGLKTVITVNQYTQAEDFIGANLVVSEIGTNQKPFKVMLGDAHGESYLSPELLDYIVRS